MLCLTMCRISMLTRSGSCWKLFAFRMTINLWELLPTLESGEALRNTNWCPGLMNTFLCKVKTYNVKRMGPRYLIRVMLLNKVYRGNTHCLEINMTGLRAELNGKAPAYCVQSPGFNSQHRVNRAFLFFEEANFTSLNKQTTRKKKTLAVTDYTHQSHSLAKVLSAHWFLFKSEPHFSSMILYLALSWHHDKIKTSPDDRRSLFVEVSTHINVINLAAREDKIAHRQDSFSLL